MYFVQSVGLAVHKFLLVARMRETLSSLSRRVAYCAPCGSYFRVSARKHTERDRQSAPVTHRAIWLPLFCSPFFPLPFALMNAFLPALQVDMPRGLAASIFLILGGPSYRPSWTTQPAALSDVYFTFPPSPLVPQLGHDLLLQHPMQVTLPACLAVLP